MIFNDSFVLGTMHVLKEGSKVFLKDKIEGLLN